MKKGIKWHKIGKRLKNKKTYDGKWKSGSWFAFKTNFRTSAHCCCNLGQNQVQGKWKTWPEGGEKILFSYCNFNANLLSVSGAFSVQRSSWHQILMAVYKRQCVPSHDRSEQVTGKEQEKAGGKKTTHTHTSSIKPWWGGWKASGWQFEKKKNSSRSDTSGSWEAVVLSYQRVHKLQYRNAFPGNNRRTHTHIHSRTHTHTL